METKIGSDIPTPGGMELRETDMRKVAAFLMALSFVLAVSGIAFAGGDGFCAYSKHNTAEKANTNKPVAQKSDSQNRDR